MNEQKESFHPYGIFVWLLAILFYLYEFFLRVMPATVSKDVLRDLDITLSQFALISSAYYITYAIMQTPVGILVDRFGARLLSTLACIICTLGLVSFAFSDNFYNAIISRLFIGFGSSFGYVTLLVLALNWFPRKHFGFLSGLGQALGAVGPLLAGAPVIYLLHALDDNLRTLFLAVAVYGAILAIFMGFFIRNHPAHTHGEIIFIAKERNLKKDLLTIIKLPQIWITMIYTGCVYVSLPMLGAYFGTLYLDSRGFSKEAAGLMISMIWIGLAIGSPLMGRLSDKIKRRKPVLAFLCLLGVASVFALIFFPTNNQWLISFFLILVGVAGAGQSLAFAFITEHAPNELKATAVGANNTANMFFASVIPPLATILIHPGVEDTHIYMEENFIKGFLFMPFAFFIAFLMSAFFMKETFCRPQQSIHPIE